jgi:peroxiredoxin
VPFPTAAAGDDTDPPGVAVAVVADRTHLGWSCGSWRAALARFRRRRWDTPVSKNKSHVAIPNPGSGRSCRLCRRHAQPPWSERRWAPTGYVSLEQSHAPDFTLESTAGESVTLSETLDEGPTVVLINRGHWCSFCAEQLQTFSEVAYDLWFNDSVDVLPVVTDTLGKATEMRDRYDLDIQLLADPDGEVAEQYSGTEETSHGLTGVAATYVVDADGTVRYEQVADHPGDRTYGNYVRYFIRNDFADPFGGA